MNYIFNSPGGPQRAPVFEHAPSSPSLVMDSLVFIVIHHDSKVCLIL